MTVLIKPQQNKSQLNRVRVLSVILYLKPAVTQVQQKKVGTGLG